MKKTENRFVRLRLHISNKVGRPLNTTQLAKELGVSRSLLSMVESGERPASSNLALRFQKKFGIDPSWVRGGLGPAPWETYEDQHVFNSMVVDQKREDGEYPDDPIEKAGLAKQYIDQIADDPRAGIILDHLIEASRDKYYQYTLYKGLAGGFVALRSDRDDLKKMVAALRQKIRIGEEQYYDEKRKSRKLKKELAELRAAGGDTGAGRYNNKDRPDLRMTADPTFESTEVILKFPEKPSGLDKDESGRWDRNELALRRWEKTDNSFNAPPWAVERFCRQVVHFYEGGNLHDIGGLLKDIIEEGKERKS